MSPTAPPAQLRIGVLLDGWQQPRWVLRLLTAVAALDCAQFVVAVENDLDDLPDRSVLQRFRAHPELLLFHLYRKLDDRVFGRDDDALALCDVQAVLAGVPRIRVRPQRKQFSDIVSDADCAAIAEHRPDVLLRFGFRILRGRILGLARYGLWSYHHGDNRVNRGGPPGMWEVLNGEQSTGVTLQILGENLDGGRVLSRSLSPTDARSVRRNNAYSYAKGAALVPRKLVDLHRRGEAALADRDDFLPYSRPLYRSPDNLVMLRGMSRLAHRYVSDKLAGVTSLDQWQLAFRFEAWPPDLFRYRPIVPPNDRFWADPFPYQRDGRHYVFLEELLYAVGRGHIAVMEIARDGTWTQPKQVLELPCHASYPFVFDWQGELFMVPETADAARIELFRCTRFPDQWTSHAVLMEGRRAVDTTLHEHDGRWWMFTVMAEPGAGTYDELHLFHAETPVGPWTPHPQNPVRSDVVGARPAGRVFEWREGLYRPGQDCSGRYGRAIVIHRIEQWDTETYRERAVSRIDADWAPDLLATHTLNHAGQLSVIDVLRRRPRGK